MIFEKESKVELKKISKFTNNGPAQSIKNTVYITKFI